MKKIGLVFILIFCFVIYFIAVSAYYPDMSARGQFGDAFGGINALFSGLALLGIIYTIFLQKKELGLQRKELELTREELKRTAGAQEKSEKALSRQAESLKVTAKLNGLSARLQHYNTLIELTNSPKYGINTAEFNTHKREADLIIEEIRRLTDDK